MTFKESLLKCISTEIKTCQYLATKIPAGSLDFRPGANVRSTLELLQYLSWTGVVIIRYFLNTEGEKLGVVAAPYTRKASQITLENFSAAMDEEFAEIEEIFSTLSEEELMTRQVSFPWRTQAPLGQAIMETSVKWFAAYKMQLFLNIKLSGAEINTMDCWAKPYMEEQAA